MNSEQRYQSTLLRALMGARSLFVAETFTKLKAAIDTRMPPRAFRTSVTDACRNGAALESKASLRNAVDTQAPVESEDETDIPEPDDETLAAIDQTETHAQAADEQPDTCNEPMSAVSGVAGRSGMSPYARSLRTIPKLELAEELELGRLARSGDSEAAHRLVVHNLHIVPRIAKTYTGSTVPIDDLVEEGNLGLLHAVGKFDPDRGFRFSTYANWWIHHMMRNVIMSHSRAVRLPVHVQRRLGTLRRQLVRFESEDRASSAPSKEARSSALSRAAHATGVTLQHAQQLFAMSESALSLDMPVEQEPGLFLKDTLEDTEQPPPEASMMARQRLALLIDMINQLPEAERIVIDRRFGFSSGEAETLESVAAVVGLSAERVRQLQKAAVERLRQQFEQRGVSLAGIL